MNSRQEEFNKISMYKENWYALIACICSERTKSVAESCKGLGIKLKSERHVKIYKEPIFDLDKVKALYEELGIIRQMAIKMGVCEGTLRLFMKANGIETNKLKPKISDGYAYHNLDKLMKEGAQI